MRPAIAALASPAPMDAATSATVTACAKSRVEPSGNWIEIMMDNSRQTKSAVSDRAFVENEIDEP
jgi:hypothetical protein